MHDAILSDSYSLLGSDSTIGAISLDRSGTGTQEYLPSRTAYVCVASSSNLQGIDRATKDTRVPFHQWCIWIRPSTQVLRVPAAVPNLKPQEGENSD